MRIPGVYIDFVPSQFLVFTGGRGRSWIPKVGLGRHLAGAPLTPGVISMSRGFDGFDIDDFAIPNRNPNTTAPAGNQAREEAAVHSLEAP